MAHLVINNCRVSYANLTQPKDNLSGKPKYSCVILVPKTDTAMKAAMDNAFEQAKREGIAKKWGGKVPPGLMNPVRDGDGTKPRGGEYGPECKGMWVLNAASNPDHKPRVVDAYLQDILDPTEIYSGMICNVAVDFYAFAAPGNSGISVGLGNVQKIADAEPFSGGARSIESDFTAADPFA